MKVNAYSCGVDSGLFLIMPAEGVPDSLPQEERQRLGTFRFFKEFDLTLAQPLVGLHVARALDEIGSKGYSFARVQFFFEEGTL